jgi:hypothetical protein
MDVLTPTPTTGRRTRLVAALETVQARERLGVSMKQNLKISLCLGMVLGGCLGDADLETDEPATETEEQELALPRDHFQKAVFGGNLWSQPIDYITEQFSPQGTCTLGYRRPAEASVSWLSPGGGHCRFAGWATSDEHDCRARIIGSTPGGFWGGECITRVMEVAEGAGSTTPAGMFSYNVANTSSALINTVNRQIALNAGQRLTIGTCGMIGSSFNGDTFLRLVDGSANEVAQSDDSLCGRGSMLMFTAPASATFTVRAGCYQQLACSGTVSWTID